MLRHREPSKKNRPLLRPRLPVRRRLALLYGAMFLVSGVVLLATMYSLLDAARYGSTLVATPGSPGSGPAIIRPALEQRTLDLHSLLAGASIALGILAVLSVAFGWVVAGRVLRPLRRITASTRRISERNLHERLALEGPSDEITELSGTIDGLLARLERSFDSQRRFVANASHELRTPLTVIQAMLQVALVSQKTTLSSLRSTCEEALQAGREMEQLIESLLTLARSGQEVDGHERFDLARMVKKTLEVHRREADDRHISIEATLSEAHATGDPAMAESLVSNLVQNALAHNRTGGRAWIATNMVEGRASIRVANTGPVIPAEEVHRLFQPFQQLGGRRIHATGHGLGLAIVHAIADAHGAILTTHARDEGGLDIELRFPPYDAAVNSGVGRPPRSKLALSSGA